MAASGNMKQLYDITKKFTGKFGRTERPVKYKNGSVLMGVDKQLSRWTEHFEELLNRPALANMPDISNAEEDLPIDCGTPTREEITKPIKQLKNGKQLTEKFEVKNGVRQGCLLIQTLINQCLHRIRIIHWPEQQISNENLWARMQHTPEEEDIQ